MSKQAIVVGIDEVGRGPWAGPLVASAVVLPIDCQIRGVKDSKLIPRAKRSRLAHIIRRRALGIGIGWVGHEEVDQRGLTWANRQAMIRALDMLDIGSADIVIDGKYNYLSYTHPSAQAIIKADRTHLCVSAASIIAKVARDNFMLKMASLYPNYGFGNHVGYGTPEHRARLLELGPSPIHRQSFKPIWIQQLSFEETSVD